MQSKQKEINNKITIDINEIKNSKPIEKQQ
jgi:hypothetical protein